MRQLNPDLCVVQFIAYRLSEILRQPLADWIKKKSFGALSSRPFQKLLVPEDWTENFFFLNQLLPQSFEPFGELLNITIVLIIVITSICKSRALNTSTSFHFIFYHKLKTGQHAETSFFDWLLILFQRSRIMPCFLTPGYQESEKWWCPIASNGEPCCNRGHQGIDVSPSLLVFVLFITLLGGL